MSRGKKHMPRKPPKRGDERTQSSVVSFQNTKEKR